MSVYWRLHLSAVDPTLAITFPGSCDIFVVSSSKLFGNAKPEYSKQAIGTSLSTNTRAKQQELAIIHLYTVACVVVYRS